MKNKFCIGLLFMVSSWFGCLYAQKWLPLDDISNDFRLLGCFYDLSNLDHYENLSVDNPNWNVAISHKLVPGGIRYKFSFKAKRAMQNTGVAVAFDHNDWSSDNYVMIPASVYNGNRQRIVNRAYATGLDKTDYFRKDLALTSNPIPQLSPSFGERSLVEVLVNNTSTPAITCLDRHNNIGTIFLTDQGISHKGQILDYGLIVEESRSRDVASFVISAPGVREKKPQFIGFSKSPDRGISVNTGDEITIEITRLDFYCKNVPELLEQFIRYRKSHIKGEKPRNLMPMSEVFEKMVVNIDERYFENDKWGFYCPENAEWMSFGWIGGLINTYPMLALGDDTHLNKVSNTFDFALSRAKGQSGYYYDTLGKDGNVLNRDASRYVQGIGLTRKNADILYWMIKQFNLLKAQGKSDIIKQEWEKSIKQLADAFVNTWQKYGTWGNYIQVETGDIAVYNTTGGAMAIAGLVLASEYFHNVQYLEIAEAAADFYYKDFSLVGFTSGGCGDILQNSDSETAIALTTSMMTLYEATGYSKYLKQCLDLANLCATWTVSFAYQLPKETPLGKLDANLTGAVWASTQNKHGAPGFCTQSGDVLFKLYRETGDELYAELLRDVIHAHAEGIQPNGKITERLTYCDADSRGSRGDGGKTGWNETNGALMALEIPSVYVRKDLKRLFVFDHVEADLIKKGNGLYLQLFNPTKFDAKVTIFSEDSISSRKPLGDNAFLNWNQKVNIKSGRTVKLKLR